MNELTIAEQVLLSAMDGMTDREIEEQLGRGMEYVLEYIRRLRSCTEFHLGWNEWVKLPNYNEVMSQPIYL